MAKKKPIKSAYTDEESNANLTKEWLCVFTGTDGSIERWQSGYYRTEEAWIFEFSSVNRLVVKQMKNGLFAAYFAAASGPFGNRWCDDAFLCELRTHDQLFSLLNGLGVEFSFHAEDEGVGK